MEMLFSFQPPQGINSNPQHCMMNSQGPTGSPNVGPTNPGNEMPPNAQQPMPMPGFNQGQPMGQGYRSGPIPNPGPAVNR